MYLLFFYFDIDMIWVIIHSVTSMVEPLKSETGKNNFIPSFMLDAFTYQCWDLS